MRLSTRASLALVAFNVTVSIAAPTVGSELPAALQVTEPVEPRAFAQDAPPERPRTKKAVHPVVGRVSYGSAEARFGDDRGDHIHEGQDVFAPTGTPLVAVRDGIVVETGSDGGRGNYLILYSPEANETYHYFHMVEPSPLRADERVRAGEQVGAIGCTGSCFGEHLHFEVHEGRDPYADARDPLGMLKRLPRIDEPK